MADRAGDNVDGFQLLDVLGQGGNGVVWRAVSDDFGEVALKLLQVRNPEKEAFQRFAREVEVQGGLRDDPGVLPLLDAQVPADRSRRAWLATPVALPLSDPRTASELPITVERVATLAATLADLHGQGIAHRDIKPANLFLHEGRAVLGDLGLVDDPRALPITDEAGVLGPRHYVAWEVLDDPDADWRPADVFALGKTLWVLATRQRFPVPGEHRPEELAMAVGSYTPHPLAGPLDEILRSLTRLDPSQRIGAAEMAAALAALVKDAPLPAAAAPDEAALRRLADRLRPAADEASRRDELIAQLSDVLGPAADAALARAYERVREVAPHHSEMRLHPTTTLGWRTLTDEMGSPDVLAATDLGFWAFTDDPDLDWSLSGGVALELLGDGRLRVLGVLALLRARASGYQRLLECKEEIETLSPRAEQIVTEAAGQVVAQLERGFTAWSDALDND